MHTQRMLDESRTRETEWRERYDRLSAYVREREAHEAQAREREARVREREAALYQALLAEARKGGGGGEK